MKQQQVSHQAPYDKLTDFKPEIIFFSRWNISTWMYSLKSSRALSWLWCHREELQYKTL